MASGKLGTAHFPILPRFTKKMINFSNGFNFIRAPVLKHEPSPHPAACSQQDQDLDPTALPCQRAHPSLLEGWGDTNSLPVMLGRTNSSPAPKPWGSKDALGWQHIPPGPWDAVPGVFSAGC